MEVIAVTLVILCSMGLCLYWLHQFSLVELHPCVNGLLRFVTNCWHQHFYSLDMLHYHFLLSQVKKHSAYLMTIEMSIVGSLCLFVSMTKSPDGEAIRKFGFFHDWTSLTLEIWELMDVAATQEHLVEA